MNISLITPYTESSLQAIKIAALYFDTVEIQQHSIIQIEKIKPPREFENNIYGKVQKIVQYIDDDFKEKVKPLLHANILKIVEEPDLSDDDKKLEMRFIEFLYKHDHLILEIIRSNKDIRVTSEIHDHEIHEKLIGPLLSGSLFYPAAIFQYYSALFSDTIRLSSENRPIVSSSQALYRILKAASNSELLQNQNLDKATAAILSPKFIFDVIKTIVIDIGDLELEQVLEARYQLKDELYAFRNEIDRLQFEFEQEFGSEKVLSEGRAIANARLRPRIEDLERKVEKEAHKILKDLFGILRKPDPYVPMLGTSFAGIPLELSLLISLGIVSLEMGLDIFNSHKDIRRDGLFYLLKLRQKSKAKFQSQPKKMGREIISPKQFEFAFPWQIKKVDE